MNKPHRFSLDFEQIQQNISRAKILLVELASLIALAFILFHGLMAEFKW